MCTLATHVFLGEHRHWVISVWISPRNLEPCGAAAGKMTAQWEKKRREPRETEIKWWKKKSTRNMFFLLSWSNQNESGWQQKNAWWNVCDTPCLWSNAQQTEDNTEIHNCLKKRRKAELCTAEIFALSCITFPDSAKYTARLLFFFYSNRNWKRPLFKYHPQSSSKKVPFMMSQRGLTPLLG